MNEYCLYLRKSRADTEAEAHGEGETLARHEKTLLETAKRMRLNITGIYREIVSGESIAARPEMQRLLQDVENGMWDGVLVMEVERLARGDTIDQGLVAQTFKYTDTKIITPMKVYDPSNEFDEEYFEFGLFMSRREYKTINRRLQAGRLASAKEGKYPGNQPPYGYKRVKLEHDKGWTLEPVPEEAEIVRLIFDLYTRGELMEDGTYRRIGPSLICKKFNEMHLTAKKGGVWTDSSVRDILSNPIYIGKIRWNWRPSKKTMNNGSISKSRPRKPNDCLIVDGLHPAIISEETFNLAQTHISKNPIRPLNKNNTLTNPLAGIIVCGKCGRRLIRKPAGNRMAHDILLCPGPTCDNISSALSIVEQRLIDGLKSWLEGYKLQWDNNQSAADNEQLKIQHSALKKIQADLSTYEKQLLKTHDLLEQEVYTTEMFLERSKILANKIQEAKTELSKLNYSIELTKARLESQKTIIPTIEKLLDVYWTLPTAKAKNDMLKEVLEKAVYTKEQKGSVHGCRPDIFDLVLYPRIPHYPAK